MPTFRHGDLRLSWTEHGNPDGPPLVLLHGLLLSSANQERVARALEKPRVLLLDLHGHGRSSQPADPARYTWQSMVDDVTALLDHLEIEKSALGGLSLGANVAIAAAEQCPERLSSLILEMPVLARGSDVAKPLFNALAAVYGGISPLVSPLTFALRRSPLKVPLPEMQMMIDLASHRPKSARAVLRGLLDDEPPGQDEDTVRAIDLPALVIGHRLDPLHPLDDARWLVETLPNARLVEAATILSNRFRYRELAGLIDAFLA
jgi:pimeloyl-ACP methyl ester carboxylesterase